MDWSAAVVRGIIAREFPTRQPMSVTPTGRGNHKQTAVVRFTDGGSVVVQVASDPAAVRLEVAVSRAISERTSIPVPNVVATGSVGEAGYAVVEHVSGNDLHERFADLSRDTQRQIARRFGRALAELHDTFSFDGYGSVHLESGVSGDVCMQAANASDWGDWFRGYTRAGIDALPPAFDDVRPALTSALAAATIPDSPTSSLYPWDLRPGNALIADQQVSAVLDWGDPLAAAPGLSVAKAEHLVADWYVADGSALRAAFKSGYEMVETYPEVLPLYRLAAIARSAVDSNGIVTRPRYPEIDGDDAVEFHVNRFDAVL